jgi:thiamine-monophosphate kinase
MTKLNEREIIDLFISKLGIKNENDDVVIFPLKGLKSHTATTTPLLVLKCDMLVESTDVPHGMRPWQIARKSIVASVSDLSAKGIKPPYICAISIGIPTKYSKSEIKDLIDGFKKASKEFGVKIVGGDTNKSNELIIDCSIVGVLDDVIHIPKRNGAKPGDLIVCSGKFGYSASGLKILMSNTKSEGQFRKNAILSVTRPRPQQRFGIQLAKYFSSSIDSSDGLAISLYELARQSKVNFFVDNIPSVNGIKEFAQKNHLDDKSLVFYGGEEYEIVATISQSNLEKAKSSAKKSRLKLHVIGKVHKGCGKVFTRNKEKGYSLLDNSGYIHFYG